MDDVEEDLKSVGIREWKRKALDEWKKNILEQAQSPSKTIESYKKKKKKKQTLFKQK